jgi:hypothetical protein
MIRSGCCLVMAGFLSSLSAVCKGAPSEVSTRFFSTHANECAVLEQGDKILFANRQVGLEFRRLPGGFELTRLHGIAEEQDFLTEPAAAAPRNLFEIRVALDPKYVGKDERAKTQDGGMAILERMASMGNAFVIGSQNGKTVSWREEKGTNQSTLHLEWTGLDVQEDQGVLDVDVNVTLRDGDPFSRWRIAIRNRSGRYGIERVRMPILSLAPIGDVKKNVFIYPKWRGGCVEDPFNAQPGFGEDYQTTGAFYPYYVNMQFWALYNRETARGIYLATQDPAPSMTHFLVSNTPGEIAWSVGHFPPNMSFANEDFVLPYDCVVGPFRGDWYDACQIYRDWALKQSWCRKGPLATRPDVPKWYKEAPLFFYSLLNDSATGTRSFEENLTIAADNFREWLKWSGMKLPANFYGWAAYRPDLTAYDLPFLATRTQTFLTKGRWSGLLPADNRHGGTYPKIPAMRGFSEACEKLRNDGGMVCPYVALELYDQGPTENAPYANEARPNVVRDSYGALCTWPGEPVWAPCCWTPWWKERLKENCVTMLQREHIGGFYLDVMHGMSVPCFWTPHGHTAAGGDSMPKGLHELCGYVRDAIKDQDPEAITTGEDSTENMIDVIDGLLYQRTLRPENKVPLFGVVYKDYILRYGHELSVDPGWQGRYKATWRPDAFYIECASLFVEGAQIKTRLRPRDISLSFQNLAHKEMIGFLGKIVGYYRQEGAKKFLVYGQLLRPLTFTTPSPMPMLDYSNYEVQGYTDTGASLGRVEDLRFPALMSGVFRAMDGELGVFVVNASAKDLTFKAALDPARYGLPTSTMMKVEELATDGTCTEVLGKIKGPVPLSGSLPGHGLTLFRLSAAVP